MKMIMDLMKFFIIWFFLIFMFVSVAALIFGEVHDFHNLSFIIYNYIESSLGNWDLTIYDDTTEYDEPLVFLKHIGRIYHLIFLVVNLVLMLNFIIAILSDTYANYIELKNGLYYNELVMIFPYQDWDDRYGCLVCAQPPFNFIVPFIIPILMYYEKDENMLKKVNERICKLFYIPIAMMLTGTFFAINAFLGPVGFVYNVYKLTI